MRALRAPAAAAAAAAAAVAQRRARGRPCAPAAAAAASGATPAGEDGGGRGDGAGAGGRPQQQPPPQQQPQQRQQQRVVLRRSRLPPPGSRSAAEEAASAAEAAAKEQTAPPVEPAGPPELCAAAAPNRRRRGLHAATGSGSARPRRVARATSADPLWRRRLALLAQAVDAADAAAKAAEEGGRATGVGGNRAVRAVPARALSRRAVCPAPPRPRAPALIGSVGGTLAPRQDAIVALLQASIEERMLAGEREQQQQGRASADVVSPEATATSSAARAATARELARSIVQRQRVAASWSGRPPPLLQRSAAAEAAAGAEAGAVGPTRRAGAGGGLPAVQAAVAAALGDDMVATAERLTALLTAPHPADAPAEVVAAWRAEVGEYAMQLLRQRRSGRPSARDRAAFDAALRAVRAAGVDPERSNRAAATAAQTQRGQRGRPQPAAQPWSRAGLGGSGGFTRDRPRWGAAGAEDEDDVDDGRAGDGAAAPADGRAATFYRASSGGGVGGGAWGLGMGRGSRRARDRPRWGTAEDGLAAGRDDGERRDDTQSSWGSGGAAEQGQGWQHGGDTEGTRGGTGSRWSWGATGDSIGGAGDAADAGAGSDDGGSRWQQPWNAAEHEVVDAEHTVALPQPLGRPVRRPGHWRAMQLRKQLGEVAFRQHLVERSRAHIKLHHQLVRWRTQFARSYGREPLWADMPPKVQQAEIAYKQLTHLLRDLGEE